MATQTRPFLKTGAALATAAAIVAASPGLAPSASIASPNALSTAAYELTTFADVFTIPTDVWTNLLFGSPTASGDPYSYGGFVGPENTPLAVEPWATYCSYECTISGPSGALYLGLDALVNGNGNGWDDRDNWGVGIVNYLFEPTFARAVGGGGSNFTIQTGTAGLSAATAYILQATLGQASPVLSTFIEVAFYGPYLVTIAWEDFLNLAASAVSGIPVIGPYLADSITAYAGELPAPGSTPEDPIFYQAGLSGILQYWINTLTGGTIPPPQTAAAVAAPLAARAAAAVTEAVTAPAAEAATPAVEAVEAAPVEAGTVSETEGSASVDTPAADAPESAPVDEVTPTAADVKADAEPADSPSSAVADATSEEGSAPASAPSKATSKRPVRDAIAKVTEAATSAVDSVKAGAASAPAAADAS
ncbi:MAG: hypothetical protein K8R24_13420 [Mycobacterium sp.]|jgi:hypothetical protein|nr:hypothetical protein [Mycobacterium sp.]